MDARKLCALDVIWICVPLFIIIIIIINGVEESWKRRRSNGHEIHDEIVIK